MGPERYRRVWSDQWGNLPSQLSFALGFQVGNRKQTASKFSVQCRAKTIHVVSICVANLIVFLPLKPEEAHIRAKPDAQALITIIYVIILYVC